jgi:uncharacterized caspase-like protein
MNILRFTYALLMMFSTTVAFSQGAATRGVGVRISSRDGSSREVKLYQGSYALVIGNSSYRFWDQLPGVRTDVDAVRKALVANGFIVETELDLDSKNLIERIDRFVNDHGFEKDGRLLVYFAGHGHTQRALDEADDRELGFIVPIDAPLPQRDLVGFLRRAVSLEKIRTIAREIQAKHALFLFDSCFSGKLVSRGNVAVPSIIEESVSYPVRQFITSGAANQTVPDESIFRRAFIRGIEGDADLNKDGFVLGSELAAYLRDAVTNYSHRKQTPQYGKIDDIALDRGDFVFVVSASSTAPVPTNPVPEAATSNNPIKTVPQGNVSPGPMPAPKGNKSNKILFVLSATTGNKISPSEINAVSAVFVGILTTKLGEQGLSVLNFNRSELSADESSQYSGGINSRNDESALRLLPVALVFHVNIDLLEDLPQFQGLFVANVTGELRIISPASNRTLRSERFDAVRGFGNTPDQARKNALRSAAEGISNEFLESVKVKAPWSP